MQVTVELLPIFFELPTGPLGTLEVEKPVTILLVAPDRGAGRFAYAAFHGCGTVDRLEDVTPLPFFDFNLWAVFGAAVVREDLARSTLERKQRPFVHSTSDLMTEAAFKWSLRIHETEDCEGNDLVDSVVGCREIQTQCRDNFLAGTYP
jgi:hypothetical protein